MATHATANGPKESSASARTVDLSGLVREPQQERSRKTLARLVDATHRLLEEEGPAALTVTGVAQSAGTSVGSFYARFDGKEELVRYVAESALADALDAWSAAVGECRRVTGGDHGERSIPGLTSLAAHLLQALQSGPAARVQSMDGLQDPTPTRRQRLIERFVGDLEELLEPTEARAEARWLAARGFVAVVRSVAGDDQRDPSHGAPEDLPAEVAAMLELYLAARGHDGGPDAEQPAADPPGAEQDEPGADEPPDVDEEESPADPVDPFDVWG